MNMAVRDFATAGILLYSLVVSPDSTFWSNFSVCSYLAIISFFAAIFSSFYYFFLFLLLFFFSAGFCFTAPVCLDVTSFLT